MAPGLAQQNVIAVVWDFDKTLTPQYMQEPLFRHYQVDPAEFWAEVNALPAYYASQGLAHIPNDSVYLNHILTYVRHGVFAGLNNALLRRLGGQIDFYAGLPDFFDQLRASIAEHPDYSRAAITLEHYVVSTGLRELIVGSDIYDHVDGVWGCEFAEHVAPPGFLHDGAQVEMADTRVISDVVYVIDNTSKTRALFELSKGSNIRADIDVNAKVDQQDRRVPFSNMVCVADGPSDVPIFSVVNQFGGSTFAVYKPGSSEEFRRANLLQQQNRVDSIGPADYTPGSPASLWIENAVHEVAERIVHDRELELGKRVGPPPRHIPN
ncbi:MAG TPA: haloacid dehalogenase-like hydrolase [Dehalococcoidia bacterium]|nr:haloacid dehalogenase-like hydrolase [Dehalococcoidia bacterium]